MSEGTAPAPKFQWSQFLPDVRVWVVIGFFALAWRLLYMIEERPDLLNSAPFMSIAVLILGTGGLGTIVALYYGGTKVGGEVMKANAETLQAVAPPPPPGSTTTTTTTAPPA